MKNASQSAEIYDMHNTEITIEVVAENALLLSWQAKISLSQHNEIIAFQTIITQQLNALIVESVASYHCLMVYFNLQLTTSAQLIDKISALAKHQQNNLPNKVKSSHSSQVSKEISKEVSQQNDDCINIPVYYDTEQQWDLADVAQRCNMSVDEVIKQHSAQTYHGYALGFTPGFCYLASLPTALHLPRKSSPRLKVPQGAVAIAEQQSAIYPIESPGGWHVIGLTPLPMFTSKNGEFNAAINVGQNVKFYAITKAEFITLKQGINS